MVYYLLEGRGERRLPVQLRGALTEPGDRAHRQLEVMARCGFTVEHVVATAKAVLAEACGPVLVH